MPFFAVRHETNPPVLKSIDGPFWPRTHVLVSDMTRNVTRPSTEVFRHSKRLANAFRERGFKAEAGFDSGYPHPVSAENVIGARRGGAPR